MGMDLSNRRTATSTITGVAMIKKRNKDDSLSSMSYLDTITCGFGAILLLLIVVNPEPVEIQQPQEAPNLESQIESALATISNLRERLDAILNSQNKAGGDSVSDAEISRIERSIRSASLELDDLLAENQGLELAKESLKQSTIRQTTQPEKRDLEVGGIPVDSEYVIFVVDTSGSMQTIWGTVMDTMSKILDIHPKVAGFQVLNDNGAYLLDGFSRRWIPDTSVARKNIKNVLSSWTAFSNSNPVEGLEIALRTYASKENRISIYILGDEFTGNSYDQVINTLATLNTDRTNGKIRVRVHSIGFTNPAVVISNRQYATLMRAVAEKNRGAFLGLPY